ncbi:hypothetical protein LEMA_P049000.1 [Plenodomus lingam JN3]|uniref:Ima1 N-terminal domain-containing protein n=2 Tax=Leptosphaeria maculans TaxID=5022 RepID=E5R4S1_LEPMJ|nr:hypothetical protein LEMA_P049000.1 [Plenodomus lingam JN3]CBX92194.1 hypothetical protein LEMA_P049000.1 [Plenodomus lingam JN3]
MPLLRRRLRCHYCNVQSRDSVSKIPQTYLCPHCDALNHFDQRGNIADPPLEEITTATSTSHHYARSRSPTPGMHAPAENLFCDNCLRNQAVYTKLLSEYLPDEEDPDYEKFIAAYDDYKLEVESRYPQVCAKCLPRVQAQIDNAGYAARADHLRRIMEMSEKKRAITHTWGETIRSWIVSTGKWTYLLSLVAGIFWHTMGLMMAPNDGMWEDDKFFLNVCLSQAVSVRSVDESCVLSKYVVNLAWIATLADFLSVWWNPRLEAMANVLTGRMVGLKSLWSIRLTVVALRSLSLYYWQSVTVDYNSLANFQRMHAMMITILLLGSILTWKTVRIVYQSPTTFRRATSPTLLSAPSTPQKSTPGSAFRSAHPNADIYSSMAHSLAPAIDGEETSNLPPSPTATESSRGTPYSDVTTPLFERNAFLSDQDDMDWTPTRRRFASQEPQVLPNQWSQRDTTRSPSPQPHYAHREPVSLFSKPDPNPFRHRVPDAPKVPAHAKANPWKPGIWDPPLKNTTPNFFKETRNAQGGVGQAKGLDGIGVPKNVKRDSELFASPKMKFDFYGTQKETGLEDTFNGFFLK